MLLFDPDKRRSIARTMSVGLVLVVALVVMESGSALLGFYGFQRTIRTVQKDALPRVAVSSELVAHSGKLMHLAERLAACQSDIDVRVVLSDIALQFDKMREVASALDAFDSNGATQERIQVLDGVVSDLAGAVSVRIQAGHRVNVALSNMLALSNDALTLGDGWARHVGEPQAADIFREWRDISAYLLTVGGALVNSERLFDARELERDVAGRLDQLDQLLAGLHGKDRLNLEEQAARWRETFLGSDGLATAVSDRIIATGRAMGAAGSARSLAEEFASEAVRMHTALNARVMSEATALADTVFRQSLLLLLLTVCSLCIGTGVAYYIHNYVVRRLVRLNASVMEKVNGNTSSLEVVGNDEVSDIARSVNYFASELGKAKQKAEESSGAKSQFLANMSHELRTPLSTIVGMAYLAKQGSENPLQKEYISRIESAAAHLVETISDILDFSKIEGGFVELERSPLHLGSIIQSIYAMLCGQANAKSIILSLDIAQSVPELLMGDSVRIKQILINLVGNAVKFTSEGVVSVAVRTVERVADRVSVEFSISDTGIGMDEEQLSHLFQSFHQADSSITRLYGGTGLGLAITKKLVALMAGTVQVRSRKGEGSTFTVVIPFALPEPGVATGLPDVQRDASVTGTTAPARGIMGAPGDPDGASSALPEGPFPSGSVPSGLISVGGMTGNDPDGALRMSGHVLLVEDQQINLEMTRTILERAGLVVDTAVNGMEAVEAILSNPRLYDVVLMDLQMPGMDGYEATRIIRTVLSREELPVVAMTAHAIREERDKCFACGMNEHLTKPIDIRTLFRVLQQWVEGGAPDELAHAVTSSGTCIAGVLPDSLTGLDMEAGLEIMLGDTVFYQKFLIHFRDESRQALKALRIALGRDDREKVRRIVHSVKGIAGNIAAKAVVAAAEAVERELHAGTPLPQCSVEVFIRRVEDVADGLDVIAGTGSAT